MPSGTVTCSRPRSHTQAACASSRVTTGSSGHSTTACAISPRVPANTAMSCRPVVSDIIGVTVEYLNLRPPRASWVTRRRASWAGTVTSMSSVAVGRVDVTAFALSLRRM